MLCSRCSDVVKPVLAVDIDGTLGNYHDHFTSFCGMYYQREFKYGYDGSQVNFEDYLGLTREEYRAAKLAYRQGGMKRSMIPYDGAHALLKMANALGCEVWVATTRPYQRLDNIDPDTRFWMQQRDMQYHAMLYGDDKYDQLGMHVDQARVVMVVDDLWAQVAKADALWPDKVWLVERKHNAYDRRMGEAGEQWHPRCLDMTMAAASLSYEVNYWRRTHAA